jgi:hypothetical protein
VAWRVPDLRAELADLRARGVPIQEYDAPDPKTVDGIADMGFAWSAGSSIRAETSWGSFNRGSFARPWFPHPNAAKGEL